MEGVGESSHRHDFILVKGSAGKRETYAAVEARRRPTSSAPMSIRALSVEAARRIDGQLLVQQAIATANAAIRVSCGSLRCGIVDDAVEGRLPWRGLHHCFRSEPQPPTRPGSRSASRVRARVRARVQTGVGSEVISQYATNPRPPLLSANIGEGIN
jgi:hypothetical protein